MNLILIIGCNGLSFDESTGTFSIKSKVSNPSMTEKKEEKE